MVTAKYDHIGIGYNRTRKADGYLTERLFYHLDPKTGENYLDIGCGTGNYTIALNRKGVHFAGVDPSQQMLDKAKAGSTSIDWRIGKAEDIPLAAESVNGVMGFLTMHHWTDLHKGFEEVNRVLKPHGKVVLFTSTPKQMKGYWLNHYFPQMLAQSMVQMPSYKKVKRSLENNKFTVLTLEKYFVKPDLQDLFLYSGKHQPKLYFNEQVRKGISSFSSLAHKEEVQKGLLALKKDIESGAINHIMENYRNTDGDYLFITGQKTSG